MNIFICYIVWAECVFCLLLKICIVNYDECSLNLFAWETATMYFFFLNKAFPEFMSHFWEWIMHMGMVWKCMAWEFSNNKDICKPFPFLSVFFFIFPILLCIWPPFNRLVKIWRGRKSLGEAIAQREAEPPDGQMAGLFRKFPGRRRKHATLHQEA